MRRLRLENATCKFFLEPLVRDKVWYDSSSNVSIDEVQSWEKPWLSAESQQSLHRPTHGRAPSTSLADSSQVPVRSSICDRKNMIHEVHVVTAHVVQSHMLYNINMRRVHHTDTYARSRSVRNRKRRVATRTLYVRQRRRRSRLLRPSLISAASLAAAPTASLVSTFAGTATSFVARAAAATSLSTALLAVASKTSAFAMPLPLTVADVLTFTFDRGGDVSFFAIIRCSVRLARHYAASLPIERGAGGAGAGRGGTPLSHLLVTTLSRSNESTYCSTVSYMYRSILNDAARHCLQLPDTCFLRRKVLNRACARHSNLPPF